MDRDGFDETQWQRVKRKLFADFYRMDSQEFGKFMLELATNPGLGPIVSRLGSRASPSLLSGGYYAPSTKALQGWNVTGVADLGIGRFQIHFGHGSETKEYDFDATVEGDFRVAIVRKEPTSITVQVLDNLDDQPADQPVKFLIMSDTA